MSSKSTTKPFAQVITSSAAGNSASFVIRQGDRYFRVVNIQPEFEPVPADEIIDPAHPELVQEAVRRLQRSIDTGSTLNFSQNLLLSSLMGDPGMRFGAFKKDWFNDYVGAESEDEDTLYEAEKLLATTWRSIQGLLADGIMRERINALLRPAGLLAAASIDLAMKDLHGDLGTAYITEVHNEGLDAYFLLENRSGRLSLLIQLSTDGISLPEGRRLRMFGEWGTAYKPEPSAREDAWAVFPLESTKVLINSKFEFE